MQKTELYGKKGVADQSKADGSNETAIHKQINERNRDTKGGKKADHRYGRR